MTFEEIPGLEKLKETLVSSYKRNHIAHAQLFNGKEGGPALPLAIAYATYLLCEDKQESDACGSCPNCQKMAKYIHPDVHFFYPQPGKDAKDEKESNKKTNDFRNFMVDQPYGTMEDWITYSESENKVNQISKETARSIIKTVSMKSFEGGFKIIFIWYPETLHPSAANAILKVLEEPPTKTVYLLVSYQYENLISTILSRTQHILVPGLNVEQVSSYLQQVKGCEITAARNAAILSEGNISVALRYLNSGQDFAYRDFRQWMTLCYKADWTELVQLAEDFNKRGKSAQRSLLNLALMEVRSAFMMKASESLVLADGEEREFVSNFSNTLDAEKLEKLYLELDQSIRHLERNANPRITHLALSIRITMILRQK